MRATVRARGAPYTERQGFVLADLGAFTFLAQARSASAWTLTAGVLAAPDGDRAYAAFGDPTWNHLVVQARLDRHRATTRTERQSRWPGEVTPDASRRPGAEARDRLAPGPPDRWGGQPRALACRTDGDRGGADGLYLTMRRAPTGGGP